MLLIALTLLSAASTQFGTLQASGSAPGKPSTYSTLRLKDERSWCNDASANEFKELDLSEAPNPAQACNDGTDVWSAYFDPAPASEATMVALHSDASIRFPDEPDRSVTIQGTATLVSQALEVNCGDFAAGSAVKGRGMPVAHSTIGTWQLNSDQTISPLGRSDLVLAWGGLHKCHLLGRKRRRMGGEWSKHADPGGRVHAG